jgi:hypothetical protein
MDIDGENLSVLPIEARSAISLFFPYGLSDHMHDFRQNT